MAAARLSAAVVLYGGAEEAKRCIDSIVAYTKEELAFYLVDNASPDGALATLQAGVLPPCLQVLPQGQNRGYGAGHNVVLPLLESRYHAVVNPDIVLASDALGAMANWMDAHPDVVMTTPRLVFPDGRPQYTAKRRPTFLSILARQLNGKLLKKQEDHYLMLDEDLSKPIDITFCTGAFFLVRTDVFRAIGGFDEGYFMYVEDADITQKALQRGRVVYLPEVTVAHAWHREPRRDRRKFLWQVKSMLRYFGKWGFRWA